jgi:SHS2 domain-containing protein
MSAPPAFEFVDDVTSDLSFVARGPDLAAVFAAAAEALLAATVAEPAAVVPAERLAIELEEPDLELLLLRFLAELIFLRDARGLLLRAEGLEVEAGPPARLRGHLAGERADPARHALEGDVKAATAHGLAVRAAGGGWEARVTLDV